MCSTGFFFVALIGVATASRGDRLDEENLGSVLKLNIPDDRLEVAYRQSVSLGSDVSESDASSAPTVKYPSSDGNSYYTLVMVDPDAPSKANPTAAEWLHWMIVNVKGGNNDITDGTQILKYNGPSPPSGSGKHRYVFLALKQPSQLTDEQVTEIRNSANRSGFKVGPFSQRYGLVPSAAFFYFTENH